MERNFIIKFPKIDTHNLDQDEEFFYLIESDGKRRQIFFHKRHLPFETRAIRTAILSCSAECFHSCFLSWAERLPSPVRSE